MQGDVTIDLLIVGGGFGRLLIGSMGTVIGGENGLSRHWAKRNVARRFPSLDEVELEKASHGPRSSRRVQP
jgi:hypothetical protein